MGGYSEPPKPGAAKPADAAFAPFRPPSEYLDSAEVPEEDTERMLFLLRMRTGQGLTLVHFSAQLEPCL